MAESIRINENTYRLEDGGVRFFLLEGTQKALLIDTGMNTPDARELAESTTSLPLSLLNTHADMDHISGNHSFDEFYMSPAEEENYICSVARAGGKPGKIVPVREGDIIDPGDRPLEIIDNPGHTPGSIAILDVKNRVLYGGDAIQDGNIFMFGRFRNIRDYVKSLEHILTYKDRFDVVYPCHGSFPVSPDLIDKLITGAREIMDGKAHGEEIDMFGNKVRRYAFPYAGFLCDE